MKSTAVKIATAALCLFIIPLRAAASEPARSGAEHTAGALAAMSAGDIALMSQEAVPGPPEVVRPKPLPPVVITLPGLKFAKVGIGPFNLYNLYHIFTAVFGRRNKAEQAVLEAEFADADRAEIFSGDPLMDEEPLTGDYLERKLRALPEFAANPVTVVPFAWSMAPVDSNRAVPVLVRRLAQVYDEYGGTGRPIYVVAHSWGSVLMHDALHRLAKSRPDIRIDKFITTGSPLVPGPLFLRIGMSLQRLREGLRKKVSKPANVGYWRNAWSSRDPFSYPVPAADENDQVDAKLGDVETAINEVILRNDERKPQAKRDLAAVRHAVNWHRCYYQDFRADLKSIGKRVRLKIFRPGVASQAMNIQLAF